MIIGKENLLILFNHHHMPYWIVYNGFETNKPGTILAQSDEHENNFDAQFKTLEQVLNMLAPGKYTLAQRMAPKSNTGNINTRFEIPYAPGAVYSAPAAIGSVGAVPAGFVHSAVMEKQVADLRHEFEMKEFQRQLDELRNEKKKKEPKVGALENFIQQYGPLLAGVLMNKFGIAPNGPAIAGLGFDANQQEVPPTPPTTEPTENTPPPTVEPEQNPAQKKLAYVIYTLTQKEGTQDAAVELLYRFVLFTQQNPALYDQFKPMILNTKPQENG